MYSQSYYNAIDHAAASAPSLVDSPSKVFEWAEVVVDILTFIYDKDHEQVTEDLINEAKVLQDYEE